ncbi:MAG: hypothetical protein WHX52_01820 [Anaerolineae bacterium]
MANNYRIEIQVAITKCDDEGTTTPTRQGDERFTYVLTEDQAACIDTCEQAVLNINFAAVRDALAKAKHFSALSLARAQAVAQSSSEVHVKPYRVDGEAGRITFDVHYIERDYEDPAQSVAVAIDDVGVKQQKAQRECAVASAQPIPEAQKRAHHTVARIARGTSTYILTGCGIVPVLRLVLAFLLHN